VKYPKVAPEFETLCKLTREGKSIARFGDGEMKMMDGAGYVREPPNKKLATELRNTLTRPHANLIIGIPTMDQDGDKYMSWARHKDRLARLLSHAKGPFYSAFISRPDSAQWIRNVEFAREFEKLWLGKRVWLLCEKESGALRAIKGAAEVIHCECPSHKAYKRIDEFERAAVAAKPDVAIMACGMTATCLAQRLTRRGIQAIDFGSGGSFIAKLLYEAAE
jgi:hypothetical protein